MRGSNIYKPLLTMKSRFFSLLFLLSVSLELLSQNLVPNHSFEEFEDGCPADLNELPVNWNWWNESPNSFNSCVEPQNLTDSLGWAPWNGFGIQFPSGGQSYTGLAAFAPHASGQNFREYLGCELNESLEIGETYFISFKTSMAFGNYFYPTCASSHLGVYFTTQGYNADENPLEIPNYAHVYEPGLIADTAEWVVVQGSFVADQAFSHMGLGVFFEYDQLETLNMGSMDICLSYYYIDEVCVSRFSDCLINTSIADNEIQELVIYPNPAENVLYLQSNIALSTIQVVDLSGAIVLQKDGLGSARISIDVSEISAGVYFITIEYNKEIKREKLMIVH